MARLRQPEKSSNDTLPRHLQRFRPERGDDWDTMMAKRDEWRAEQEQWFADRGITSQADRNRALGPRPDR